MNTKILYRGESRGHANHGWLNTYHTFSFAAYHNPERMNFGVLRVVNDDTVAAGRGFGTHPHDNMEIISIPTSGKLEHDDDMGHGGIIETGEIQAMSAGTGVRHSEFNPDQEKEAKFFQIWIFPDQLGYKPRYQQIKLKEEDRKNQWDQILSPNPDDKGVWIHQNAWFHRADLEAEKSLSYTLKDPSNGIFLMVMEGGIGIATEILNRRDAIGFWGEKDFEITAKTDSQILIMEIPMELPEYLRY